MEKIVSGQKTTEEIGTHIRHGYEGLRDMSLHLSGRVNRCAYACFEVESDVPTAKLAQARLETEYVIAMANLILKRIAEIVSPATKLPPKEIGER